MSKIYKTIRKVIRSAIVGTLGLIRKPKNHIHILNGHMINWNEPQEKSMEHFRGILSKLKEECSFVMAQDAVSMILDSKRVDKPTLAFTFDDGFEDCYTHIAPVLDEFGVNAIFFINPNFVEPKKEYIDVFLRTTCSPNKRPLTWKQLKDLQARGYIIGAHTMDHYMINSDDMAELEHQIGDCKKIIEEKLGTPCEYFAFPFGRLEHANSKAIDIACKHYKYVFSQSDYKHYFSFDGRVINRRHFEPFWPYSHTRFFISFDKK